MYTQMFISSKQVLMLFKPSKYNMHMFIQIPRLILSSIFAGEWNK